MTRLALLLSGVIACGVPAELVVVVDSDLAVPSELALVRVVVSDSEGRPQSLNDFVLDAEEAPDLPLSFGVVPIDGDAERMISIELAARDAARTLLFTTRVRTGFVANRILELPMYLSAECRTIQCGQEETCGRDGCTAIEVPPTSLVEVEPGDEL